MTRSRPLDALALSALFLLAAVLLALAALFPYSDDAPTTLGAIFAVVAAAMAGATFAFADRMPRWVLLAEAAAAVVFNSVLVAEAHTRSGAIFDAVAYVWLAMFVALAFPRAAIPFAAFVGAAFGLGLLASDLDEMTTIWIMVCLTTSVVAGVLGQVSAIVRRALRTDALTGALNRDGLRHAIGRLRRRETTPITIAALDLDAFKEVNDREGHASGDRLLTEAVAAWRDALRSDDVLARTGGDEFVVIMPGTTPEEAACVLDRLRAAHPVMWSAGIAPWKDGDSLETTLDRADRLMYDAKRR